MMSDIDSTHQQARYSLATLHRQDLHRAQKRENQRYAYARDAHNRARRAMKRTVADYNPAVQEQLVIARQQLALLSPGRARLRVEYVRAQSVAEQLRVPIILKRRAKQLKRAEARRAIALIAGIPSEHLDRMWISTSKKDGSRSVYFGGTNGPVGPGHGHYVLDSNDRVTYKRAPFDPHGEHNFQKVTSPVIEFDGRSARCAHEPLPTANDVFYRTSRSEGLTVRVTQHFTDDYRVSWDITAKGTSNVIWTNGNVPSGHPDRYSAPEDANL